MFVKQKLIEFWTKMKNQQFFHEFIMKWSIDILFIRLLLRIFDKICKQGATSGLILQAEMSGFVYNAQINNAAIFR